MTVAGSHPAIHLPRDETMAVELDFADGASTGDRGSEVKPWRAVATAAEPHRSIRFAGLAQKERGAGAAHKRALRQSKQQARNAYSENAEKRCGRRWGTPAAREPVWDGEGWGRDRDA